MLEDFLHSLNVGWGGELEPTREIVSFRFVRACVRECVCARGPVA